jgi:hypothetical protein
MGRGMIPPRNSRNPNPTKGGMIATTLFLLAIIWGVVFPMQGLGSAIFFTVIIVIGFIFMLFLGGI